MPNSGSGTPRRRDAGQTTAMAVTMLFLLMLFVGVVADVGQAVNRRIALQVVADTGAYTGASVMAVGLNQIAYWNEWMQRAWAAFTTAHSSAFYLHVSECDYADGVEGTYNVIRSMLGFILQAINLGYGKYATDEARRESDYNLQDLFPGESAHFSYAESMASLEVGTILPQRDFPMLMNVEEVPDGTDPDVEWYWGPLAHSSQTSLSYVCGSFPPPKLEYRDRDFGVWYKKASDEVKAFVWIVTAPATKALIFDSIFGPNMIPEMRAVAVAKPVGGSIEKGDQDYVVKMLPVSKVMLLGGFIQDDRYNGPLGPIRYVTH